MRCGVRWRRLRARQATAPGNLRPREILRGQPPFERRLGELRSTQISAGEAFTRAHVGNPFTVVLVTFGGLADAIFQGDRGLPAQLSFYFSAIQGVATIVAGTIRDMPKEALRL